MSDIIRQCRAKYGSDLDRMNHEAGQIKMEYVANGGNPGDVYSPERVKVLLERGPQALVEEPMQQRGDGSIAGPYVPTEIALANNMIEKRAVPAVRAAMQAGVNTVSSGYDSKKKVGFAIGRAPTGQVVRMEK